MQEQNRVLVVEDNEINAMVLENMLAYFGLKVDIALSGMEAVDYVKTNEYKLIFVDYIMPEMDGIETVNRIRMIQIGKPVIIAVTAEVTEELLSMFTEAGADGALEKPVEKKAITECLKKYLDMDAVVEDESGKEDETPDGKEKYKEYTKELFTAVPGLDFEYGIHYSLDNEANYVKMVKAAIRNIASFLSDLKISESFGEERNKKLRIITHSLRTLLLNLGIRNLSNDAARLEEATNKNDRKFIEFQLEDFIDKLEIVHQELVHAIEAYYELSKTDEHDDVSGKSVSQEKYQDMIRQVLVPLERYEIEFIIDGIKELLEVSQGSNRRLLEEALDASERFDYDTIRNCIQALKWA